MGDYLWSHSESNSLLEGNSNEGIFDFLSIPQELNLNQSSLLLPIVQQHQQQNNYQEQQQQQEQQVAQGYQNIPLSEPIIVPDNNSCSNNLAQQQLHMYWQQQHQQQYQQQYQQSIVNYNDYSSSSPESNIPQSPLQNNYSIDINPSPSSSHSSPEQHIQSVPSPNTSSGSSDSEKPKKTGKKRKGFDPNIDIGPDLSDILLTITSDEFKLYRNNFYSNPSKSVNNLINAQYRKIKNRESAQRSREKKSNYTQEVEGELTEANKEIEDLRQENKRLKIENDLLKKQNEAYSNHYNQFNISSSNGGLNPFDSFANTVSNMFTIGNSQSSLANSKKMFGIFVFALVFCCFIAMQPNFNGTFIGSNQSNLSNPSSSVVHRGGYTDQINRGGIFGNPGRSPLGDPDLDFDSEQTSKIKTASYDFNSLRNPNSANPAYEASPQQNDNGMINRELVQDQKYKQNVEATFAFKTNSAPHLFSQLTKPEQETQAPTTTTTTTTQSGKTYEFDVDMNNNIIVNNQQSHIPLLDDDDDHTNNFANLKQGRSTATTTALSKINNSTIELLLQNNVQIIGNLTDNINGNSNDASKTFPASSYNFKFLIDGNRFVGSSEVAKALAESHDQHVEFISLLLQINKNPPTM